MVPPICPVASTTMEIVDERSRSIEGGKNKTKMECIYVEIVETVQTHQQHSNLY